jgi:hypothetical protein
MVAVDPETWGKHGDRRDVPRLILPDLELTRALKSLYLCRVSLKR